MANLASMLPSAPKSFGRLSEAYLSAFLALRGDNPLNLPVKQSYAVILIDGLGVQNIKDAAGHAPFLNQKLRTSKSLFSGFPSTTATSLASFATGVQNGTHGLLGYRVYDRRKSKPINFLNDLGAEFDPRTYQNLETISEQAKSQGFRVCTIGPKEYERSGFTLATMPASDYIAEDSIADRFRAASRQLQIPGSLIYLYIPELDQLAHRFGVASTNWLNQVEMVDSQLRSFASSLTKATGAVVTADHGVIDVDESRHIYLEEFESLSDLLAIGGDPRVAFLYFENGIDLGLKRKQIERELGTLCDVTTIDELVVSGWLAEQSEDSKALAPDLVLLPTANRVCYHRKFAKAKSLKMIGQHGGMSKAEWEIPLIIL